MYQKNLLDKILKASESIKKNGSAKFLVTSGELSDIVKKALSDFRVKSRKEKIKRLFNK